MHKCLTTTVFREMVFKIDKCSLYCIEILFSIVLIIMLYTQFVLSDLLLPSPPHSLLFLLCFDPQFYKIHCLASVSLLP